MSVHDMNSYVSSVALKYILLSDYDVRWLLFKPLIDATISFIHIPIWFILIISTEYQMEFEP